jgi:hypothetical protein
MINNGVCNNLLKAPILGQINSVHDLPPYLPEIYFNNILQFTNIISVLRSALKSAAFSAQTESCRAYPLDGRWSWRKTARTPFPGSEHFLYGAWNITLVTQSSFSWLQPQNNAVWISMGHDGRHEGVPPALSSGTKESGCGVWGAVWFLQVVSRHKYL